MKRTNVTRDDATQRTLDQYLVYQHNNRNLSMVEVGSIVREGGASERVVTVRRVGADACFDYTRPLGKRRRDLCDTVNVSGEHAQQRQKCFDLDDDDVGVSHGAPQSEPAPKPQPAPPTQPGKRRRGRPRKNPIIPPPRPVARTLKTGDSGACSNDVRETENVAPKRSRKRVRKREISRQPQQQRYETCSHIWRQITQLLQRLVVCTGAHVRCVVISNPEQTVNPEDITPRASQFNIFMHGNQTELERTVREGIAYRFQGPPDKTGIYRVPKPASVPKVYTAYGFDKRLWVPGGRGMVPYSVQTYRQGNSTKVLDVDLSDVGDPHALLHRDVYPMKRAYNVLIDCLHKDCLARGLNIGRDAIRQFHQASLGRFGYEFAPGYWMFNPYNAPMPKSMLDSLLSEHEGEIDATYFANLLSLEESIDVPPLAYSGGPNELVFGTQHGPVGAMFENALEHPLVPCKYKQLVDTIFAVLAAGDIPTMASVGEGSKLTVPFVPSATYSLDYDVLRSMRRSTATPARVRNARKPKVAPSGELDDSVLSSIGVVDDNSSPSRPGSTASDSGDDEAPEEHDDVSAEHNSMSFAQSVGPSPPRTSDVILLESMQRGAMDDHDETWEKPMAVIEELMERSPSSSPSSATATHAPVQGLPDMLDSVVYALDDVRQELARCGGMFGRECGLQRSAGHEDARLVTIGKESGFDSEFSVLTHTRTELSS